LSSFLLRALEEFPESVEAAFEHPPVFIDPFGFVIQLPRAEAAQTHPSDLSGFDQTGGFQHPDVLLHSGRGDAESVGELGDAGRRFPEAEEDPPPGRVSESAEGVIEPR